LFPLTHHVSTCDRQKYRNVEKALSLTKHYIMGNKLSPTDESIDKSIYNKEWPPIECMVMHVALHGNGEAPNDGCLDEILPGCK
jgi:hypothetical protein